MSQQQQYDSEWVSDLLDEMADDADRFMVERGIDRSRAISLAIQHNGPRVERDGQQPFQAINRHLDKPDGYSEYKQQLRERHDDVNTIVASATFRLLAALDGMLD